MLKLILLYIATMSFSLTGIHSQENLEIEGAITIGNSQGNPPLAGTVRWTGMDFQGWNGSQWVSLISGITFAGEVMDIDGNVYPTVIIGTQEWMTQNLRTSRYQDGSLIPEVTDNTNWLNANYGAWCWYDNDGPGHEVPYGKLYNWYAVNDGRGLCPTGWHVFADMEWTTLSNFLGGTSIAGGQLKETGTTHWNGPNTGATNSSGFTAVPGGVRSVGGTFFGKSLEGYWWTSTGMGGSDALYRALDYQSAGTGWDNRG